MIFYPLDPDPWIRIFLRIRIQKGKILRIQRIRILSTDIYLSIHPSIVLSMFFKAVFVYFCIIFTYRVSHIKLDRVNGSKLRFGGQIRNLRRMNHLKNLIRLIIFFCRKCLIFRVLCANFGVKDWRKSNMIWDALYIHLVFLVFYLEQQKE